VLPVQAKEADALCAAASPSNSQAWLSFFSNLIWQAIVVYLLIAHGRTVGVLLARIVKVKILGIEAEIQPESPDALKSAPAIAVKTFGSDGFLTKDGIEELVAKSGLLEPDEKVKKSLLLFQTSEQRTWLVSTGKHLFCVLDDESTRQSGRLIQWKEATDSIKRVTSWREGTRYAVDIGKHGSWLYSPHLHPNPEFLKGQVRSLLS
jgi:hypothetical protein